MSTETFWQAVDARLAAGKQVYVAMVVANTRGSPGTLGARLLVDSDGAVEGTIGGGIMEARLVEQARASVQAGEDRQPQLRRLVHRKELGQRKQAMYAPSGLICAGEQTNLSMVLEPRRDGEAIHTFCQALADQAQRAVAMTVDAQGLRVHAADTGAAITGMQLHDNGDSDWCFCESSVNPKRLTVVGGGHCGLALARLAHDIGYWVDVYDTRGEVLAGERWPADVRRHTLADYADLNTQLTYPAQTTVVVMTAAVVHDIAALASIAALDLQWLGVMGSVAKIHEIRTQLAQQGIEQTRIDAIHGPIGMTMKSDTPAEIAVSIMAQLLAKAQE